MIQNQSLKEKQDRKIVGKREKWMLRICSKCPLPHTDWKIFLCCLRPGKKRWANNESQISIYKRSDLPASWESLAFTAHQPGHSLAALQTMCLLCSSLPELLFWGLCLMQAPGVRQAPGNVALHGLCSEPCLSHCGFTELQHKNIWLLVLQLNFSVHIPLTLSTYSTDTQVGTEEIFLSSQ